MLNCFKVYFRNLGINYHFFSFSVFFPFALTIAHFFYFDKYVLIF